MTAEVRVSIKILILTMRKHVFDGSDLIKVFDLLPRFVNDAHMLYMSEALEFITLPTFLSDPTETAYRTNLSGGSRRGCITCSLRAVQHLFFLYVTATAMREKLNYPRETL